ncbi:hypothetical protein [Psychromicrobium sp. YIM B11713]|uniref:hypothetical protein n=1 Tax=Psychromicrobium sp. YIM B11713 TaxID=3145233 RepID=UPI00374E7F0E
MQVKDMVYLLTSSGRDDDAVNLALELLRGVNQETIVSYWESDANKILKIYRLRLGREGFDPKSIVGSERILSDMSNFHEEKIAGGGLTISGRAVGFFCSVDKEFLVSCFVGIDRRFP